jgi:hypothetical protein
LYLNKSMLYKGSGRFLLFFRNPERYAKGDIWGKVAVFRMGAGERVSVGWVCGRIMGRSQVGGV